MSWTTPADARAELQRLWDRGRILKAEASGESLFPLRLRLRGPRGRELLDRFDEVREWIETLESSSRSATGSGYDIEWKEIEHRQLGRNRVPSGLVVPTRQDGLRWIGKLRQASRFDELAAASRQRFPTLETWVVKKPLTLLEHADDWERVLSVLQWFTQHPRPGIYLRQADLPGIDTKFIEARRGLFVELLDRVLPPQSVDREAGRRFEARYGLCSKPALVRLRMLDPGQRISGLSDITTPAHELARLELPIRRLFITENEINGLALPELANSAVIFGLGYALDILSSIDWIGGMEIHYWGDIDTHGFAMLDRLRAAFPEAKSLLMDRETLLHHRGLWVEETARHLDPLDRLTPEERALYEDLAADRLGRSVRLEQERVAFGWVKAALDAL
jgi:hypothetical protein